MKKLLLTAALLLLLVPLTLWGAIALWGEHMVNAIMRPDHRQSEDPITVPPDYRNARYWASLPDSEGLANLVPEGQEARSGPAPVAAFYIHPTSYWSGRRWNAPLYADSWAWEMVGRMMATQASAFNDCCDVYAPHYREATLWSFIERDTEDGLHALELAYLDVARAFDEFLRSHAGDRPFIIASHSQGTAHALRLLAHKVNDSQLRKRMVAAYLIGYHLPVDVFERDLDSIPPCTDATDTGCVMHWATYGDGGIATSSVPHWYSTGWEYSDGKETLCTNPLSWRLDEERVPATLHPGALAVTSNFGMRNMLFNQPSGDKISALPAVLPEWTWAQCRDGTLFIEPQLEGPFSSPRDKESHNYHTRDYALFYQSIRDNASLRSQMMRVVGS